MRTNHKWLKITTVSLLAAGIIINIAGCSQENKRETDFNFDWKFQKGDFEKAAEAKYDDWGWRNINLPHDWSIEGQYDSNYASGTGYLPGGTGWYRKSFQLKSSLKGKSISIEFDGIYNNSDVWINGHHLGKRPYGYSSFQYNLTEFVNFEPKTNIVAVRADHSKFADSRWYTGSGIYRNVRLVITDKLRIAHWGVYITTLTIEKSNAKIKIETAINNKGKDQRAFQLQSDILDARGKIVASQTTSHTLAEQKDEVIAHQLSIPNPNLWDIGSPYLYQLKSTIKTGGKTIDSTITTFGIRQFSFDPNKGFFLNGKNIKIKGVCLHHDAGCVGAAVPLKMWKRRFELLKSIGVNAIRTSHNPPAPEFLDLCDQMGFIVMDEAFDEFTPGKNKWVKGRNVGKASKAGYNEVFKEWAVRDIEDMVRRDRNHPSIILWSIGNEVDYQNDPFSHPILGDAYRPQNPPAENLTKYGKILVATVKKLDSSRPVTAALANVPVSNAVGFADILDVAGYNYQEKYYQQDHEKYPQRCITGSENDSTLAAWEAVEKNDFIPGQFIWSGFDYLGEANAWPNRSWMGGLLDLCGFKKPQAWFRQSIWTTEPMVYIACRRPSQSRRPGRSFGRMGLQSHWNWQAGRQVNVFCYTNCEEVELFLNGKSVSNKSNNEAVGRAMNWSVPFESGTIKAVGKIGGKAVCEYVLQTSGEAAAVKLSADAKKLTADGKDISHIEFQIVDANGTMVTDAQVAVTFEVKGPAKIIGIGNANPNSRELHQTNTHSTWQGRGLLILQSTREAGKVSLKVNAESLKGDSITIETEK